MYARPLGLNALKWDPPRTWVPPPALPRRRWRRLCTCLAPGSAANLAASRGTRYCIFHYNAVLIAVTPLFGEINRVGTIFQNLEVKKMTMFALDFLSLNHLRSKDIFNKFVSNIEVMNLSQ